MAKKTVQKKKNKVNNQTFMPFILGGVAVFAIVAVLFFVVSSSPKIQAKDLFLSSNESLVRWYNQSTYDVTLNEEGFVDGRVERKIRIGDPSAAYSFIGGYTFENSRSAKKFYEDILAKDAFFANDSVAISTSKVDATCRGYVVKQTLIKEFPPINTIHLICQKEYAVIEILLLTYKIDGPQVTTQIAASMMRKI